MPTFAELDEIRADAHIAHKAAVAARDAIEDKKSPEWAEANEECKQTNSLHKEAVAAAKAAKAAEKPPGAPTKAPKNDEELPAMGGAGDVIVPKNLAEELEDAEEAPKPKPKIKAKKVAKA